MNVNGYTLHRCEVVRSTIFAFSQYLCNRESTNSFAIMCAFKTSLVVVHEGCSKDLVEHDSFKCLCRYVAEREAQHQIKLYAVEPTNGIKKTVDSIRLYSSQYVILLLDINKFCIRQELQWEIKK